MYLLKVGTYYLKLYAKPEEEIKHETDTLDHVATLLIHANEVRDLSVYTADMAKLFYKTECRCLYALRKL